MIGKLKELSLRADFWLQFRKGGTFKWILLIAVFFHLLVLWALRDFPLYHKQIAKSVPSPVANFYAEYVPEERHGNLVQPAEQQYSVSTNLVERSPQSKVGLMPSTVPHTLPTSAPVTSQPLLSVSPPLSLAANRSDESATGVNRAGEVSLFNLNIPSQRVVYLIDFSGSMWRKFDSRTRVEVACDEVRKSIRALSPEIQFNIVVFADRAVNFQPKLITADDDGKKRAQSFLDNVPDQPGATDMLAGLQQAISMRPDSVVLITDGMANIPEWRVFERVRELEKMVVTPPKLYAVGLIDPSDTDSISLLQKLTTVNGGSFIPYTAAANAAQP